MRAYISVFCAPKRGNAQHEFEDAYRVPLDSGDGEFRGAKLRIAVSDGATESFLAGRWARHLVGACADPSVTIEHIIESAIESWPSDVARYREARVAQGRPIQWYEEPGLNRAACATLLVVDFTADNDEAASGTFAAAAIGDSCLFHVREHAEPPTEATRPGPILPMDVLEASFPLQRSVDFDSQPDLVESATTPHRPTPDILARTGAWRPGDRIYIATDAMSKWLLTQVESDRAPWGVLRDLGTPEVAPFSVWVEELRERTELRNDDVTLIRLDLW